MSKQFKIHDFVAADRDMVATGAGYSFRSYTDRVGVFGNPGQEVIYDDGLKDTRGRSTGKSFSINQSHYKLQAREGQKDYSGKALYDYFINAPFCEGSPNGDYVDADGGVVQTSELKDRDKNLLKVKTGEFKQMNVKIKLLDNELDAELALSTGLKRAEAQISSGAIDDATLVEIAAMIGTFGKPDKKMRLAVYEFAGKRPIDYFEILNSGDRAVRALVRLAIDNKTLTQKGSVIFWEETLLGNDENAAVATLLGDSKISEGLQAKVNFKIDKKVKTKK